MDDPAVFQGFLTRIGLTLARQINAITEAFGDTFSDFALIEESDIDAFMKINADNNRTRNNAQQVKISGRIIQDLKATLFELRDRAKCVAILTDAQLNALDHAALTVLRTMRTNAMRENEQRKKKTFVEMTVPKLTKKNWGDFKLAVSESLRRVYGVNEIPLTYVIRQNDTNNFSTNYASRTERLIACTVHNGDAYAEDNREVWGLLAQYCASNEEAKAITDRHKISKNGRTTWKELVLHFESSMYKSNCVAEGNSLLSSTHYSGDRANFSFATYYARMNNAFNLLAEGGPSHTKNDAQKIADFENGISDSEAIRCCREAESELERLPIHEQTFDKYYNKVSTKLTKFKTMSKTKHTNSYTSTNSTRIHQINTQGRGGRGRGRGRGRGNGRGGRGGRGRTNQHGGYGRGGNHQQSGNNGGFFGYNTSVFHPELKVYSSEEFQNLTPGQKATIKQHKINHGWLDFNVPPRGMIINNTTGYAIPDPNATRHVSPVANTQFPLPPPPTTTSPIPPPPPQNVPNTIQITTGSAGSAFGRQPTDQNSSNDQQSVISRVTIDGRAYNGPIYDANNNRIA